MGCGLVIVISFASMQETLDIPQSRVEDDEEEAAELDESGRFSRYLQDCPLLYFVRAHLVDQESPCSAATPGWLWKLAWL